MWLNLYSFGKPIVRCFFRLLFRYEVKGAEHIPKHGSVLICSNHLSYLDPPLIGVSSPRVLSYLAKEELFGIPLFGSLIRHLHAVPIRRGYADRSALRTVIHLLKDGHALLMFPEGKRSRTGHLQKARSGAGFFALNTDATVVPCAVIGHYRIGKKIRVVFGEPIEMDELKEKKWKASEVSARIMEQVRQLLDQHGGKGASA